MNLMDDPRLVGVKIRERRRYLGMSLDVLAGLTGISKSFLSMVENGHRVLSRRSHLVAIAGALRCSTDQLEGRGLAPLDDTQKATLASVPALRAAIVSLHLGGDAEVRRTVPELERAMEALSTQRRLCDYASTVATLPELLDDLAGLAAHGDELEQRSARRMLIDATSAATFTLKYLGVSDLAVTAADVACANAAALDEPAWTAAADFIRLNSLPLDSRVLARQLAERAAGRINPRPNDRDELAASGMLHLTCALNAAVAEKTDDIEPHLVEARRAAEVVGEGHGFAHLGFSPTNVRFWEVAIAVELGQGEKAVEVAKDTRPELMASRARRAAFFADLGRGMALTRKHRPRAVEALATAEKLAPQRIRNSGAVRECVADILRQERRASGSRTLRQLANRVGVA
jgi:transcriptional regulator with XRE-family HTH domain